MAEKDKDEIDRLRAALATCERERDHYAQALAVKDEHVAFASDRDLARAEAGRLRGALAEVLAERVERLCTRSVDCPPCSEQEDRMVRDVIDSDLAFRCAWGSPATPAAPSSHRARNRGDDTPGAPASLVDADERRYVNHSSTGAAYDLTTMVGTPQPAPSSEYRRGYERAVEDAVKAVVGIRLTATALPGPRFRAVAVEAIRSLLPAPREVTEAEVERLAETICDIYQDETGVDGMRWSRINATMRGVWIKMARAVLAARGEGRGGK